MLIGGAFVDHRTRIQALSRVGRFNDKCLRIQDTSVDEIDKNALAARRGHITAILNKVMGQVSKTKPK